MLVIFYTVVLIENLQIGAGQQILKMTYFGGWLGVDAENYSKNGGFSDFQ